jgi:O-antigen ligase
VEVTILMLGNRRPRTRLLGVAAVAAIGGWLTVQAVQDSSRLDYGLILLRTDNSRADAWARSFEIFTAHPLLGVGLGALPIDSAGLIPDILGSAGLLGGVLALAFLGVAASALLRAAPMYSALLLGALVDSVFEPWLFTGGSLFCLMFWVVMTHPEVIDYRPGAGRDAGLTAEIGSAPGLHRAVRGRAASPRSRRRPPGAEAVASRGRAGRARSTTRS